MRDEYEYKGRKVKIDVKKDSRAKWTYEFLIEEPSGVAGTSFGRLPAQTFENPEGALRAGREAANYRIDNPLVKPVS